MKKGNFIETVDEETAEVLKSCGFQCITNSNGKWVFVNDAKKPFTFDKLKMRYTNILTF